MDHQVESLHDQFVSALLNNIQVNTNLCRHVLGSEGLNSGYEELIDLFQQSHATVVSLIDDYEEQHQFNLLNSSHSKMTRPAEYYQERAKRNRLSLTENEEIVKFYLEIVFAAHTNTQRVARTNLDELREIYSEFALGLDVGVNSNWFELIWPSADKWYLFHRRSSRGITSDLILIKYLIYGLSQGEIASHLNLHQSSVSRTLNRGLETLGDVLSDLTFVIQALDESNLQITGSPVRNLLFSDCVFELVTAHSGLKKPKIGLRFTDMTEYSFPQQRLDSTFSLDSDNTDYSYFEAHSEDLPNIRIFEDVNEIYQELGEQEFCQDIGGVEIEDYLDFTMRIMWWPEHDTGNSFDYEFNIFSWAEGKTSLHLPFSIDIDRETNPTGVYWDQRGEFYSTLVEPMPALSDIFKTLHISGQFDEGQWMTNQSYHENATSEVSADLTIRKKE